MKERVYFYDNLKFILITLVVIGHFILYSQDYQFSKALFLFIYSFHMPLFIFITGFLSKKLTNKDGSFRLNRTINFLLLYFIFEIIVFMILKLVFNQDIRLLLFDEGDCPWYLFALAMWIPITFLLQKVKPKKLIIGSIIVGLIVGYDDSVGTALSFSRILVFYPFFLLGFYLSKEKFLQYIDKLHSKKNIIFSIITLIIIFTIFYIFADNLTFLKPIFTGKNPYSYFDLPYDFIASSMFTRLFTYVLAIIMSVLVLSIIPRKKLFFTKFGGRTLAVYVLHFIILILYFNSDFSTFVADKFDGYIQIIYIAVAIILSFILSLKCFSVVFDKIVSLKHEKLYIGGETNEK